jgi:transposase-like protein
VLQAQAESGLTLSAFAVREGLNVSGLYQWRRRLGASAPKPPTFEEIRRSEVAERPSEPARPTPERLEIVLGSGVIVRVAESFNAEALGRLLDVVGGRWTC